MTPNPPQPDPRRPARLPDSTVRDVRRPNLAASEPTQGGLPTIGPTDRDATPRETPIVSRRETPRETPIVSRRETPRETPIVSGRPGLPPVLADLNPRRQPPSVPSPPPAERIDAAAVSDPAFMHGRVVGQYRLAEQIGAGSVGVVYRGVDGKLDRPVAVKFLFATSATVSERFRREAMLASQLTHPHVVTVYQTGQFGPIPYIVTELAEGGSLEQRIRNHGPLSVPEAVALIRDIAQGLEEVHRLSILHRDLKPGNILLDGAGSAKLADFGLAKQTEGEGGLDLTKPGRILGSVPYLAPEILSGGPATVASDVYSLGCTLFHTLTGRPPFGDKPVAAVLTGHLRQPLPDARAMCPGCPESLMTILRRCCAKKAGDRPASAGEMASLLEDLLYTLSAPNVPTAKRSRRSGSRSKSASSPQPPSAHQPPQPPGFESAPSMGLGEANAMGQHQNQDFDLPRSSGQPTRRPDDIFATSTELFDGSPPYAAPPQPLVPLWALALGVLGLLIGVLLVVLILQRSDS